MPRDAQTTPSRRSTRRPKGRPRTGRRLFAFDRELGCRYVAGADEAGRGSLAGPLVAAAVLFDLERLTLGDRRALSRLNDSKQHTAEMREELYPLVMRAAARCVIVSRCVRGIYMRRAAERHPGWDFETNVGYSTPEHRAAIAANGVSPLHRLSFQSIAYTQLALEG